MKKLFFLFIINFIFINFINAQIDSALLQMNTTENTFNSKQFYLRKSKNNETAGWVLFGIGTVLIVKGIDENNRPHQSLSDLTSAFLIFGGTLSTLISIPFFISSAHTARKAAQF